MRSIEAALVVGVLCACGAGPSGVADRREARGGCPPASAVLGPAQSADETADEATWDIPLAPGRLPAGRLWLLRETTPPCEVRVAAMSPMCGPEGSCDLGQEVTLAGRCKEPGSTSSTVSMADDYHPIVVESAGPGACRLTRPTELEGEEVDRVEVPAPVKDALVSARARRGTVMLSITRSAGIDALWEVSTFDHDAPTDRLGNARENCPRETWVFVRTSQGIVQLDAPDGISGLLSDARGPRVVLTGRFGLVGNVSFDVARLPPHRPDGGSRSFLDCNH